MIPIGGASIAAAWFYTGGSRPYGYLGLGEVFVFVFFGLVATVGTMATMTPPTAAGWWGAVGVGSLASAILVANNLRDIPTDREHGKLTLAVRMGDAGSRRFYVALVAVPFVMTGLASFTSPYALLAVLAAPLVVRPMQAVLGAAQGRGLIPVLAGTGMFQLAWSALLAVGLAVGRHLV
jgi:1,4-dihydroxy-2-naphthoate octaprenyltransferase